MIEIQRYRLTALKQEIHGKNGVQNKVKYSRIEFEGEEGIKGFYR